jgi:hypothetical protein
VTDLAWELEEPEPVEASHLMRVTCCACGAPRGALAAAGQELRARCAACIGTSVAVSAELRGQYTPAFGWSARPAAVPVGLSEHPAPSVSSRDGVGTQYPSAVLKVAERARGAGWKVRPQYARGCGVHGSTGRPLAEADRYALVFHSHPMTDAGAYAVHSGGSWKSVNIAGRALGTITDLEYWLSVCGEVDLLWFEHVRAAVDDAAWDTEWLKAHVKGLHAEGESAAGLALLFDLPENRVLGMVMPKKSKRESGG